MMGQNIGKIDDILSVGMKGMAGHVLLVNNLASATEGLSTKNTLLLLSQKGVSAETAKQILLSKKVSEEEIKQAMATYSVAGSQTATTGTTISLSNAYKGLAASIGLSTAALTAWIGAIAVIAVGAVAINKYIHRVEDAKNALDEFNAEIETKRDTYKSHADLIDKVSESYDNLASKVDTDTNVNLDLSEEEYKEFLNLTNEIADAFPTLVKGVDESGNAILNLGNDCDNTTEKLRELLETENQVNNAKIATELPEYFKNTETVIKDYDNQIKNFQRQINELSGTATMLNNISTGEIDLFKQNKFSADDLGAKQYSELHNLLNKSLDEFVNGLSSVEKLNLGNLNIGVSDFIKSDGQNMWLDLVNLDPEQKTELEAIIKDNINTLSLTVNDELANAQMSLNQAESSKESSWKDFTQNLISGMNSKASFQVLSAEGQQLATALVQGLDSGVAKDIDDLDPYKYVLENIISPLSNLNESDAQKVTDAYTELLTLNPNDLSQANQTTIDNLIKSIAQLLGMEENQLRINLGFEIDENFKSKYDEAILKVTENLGVDKAGAEGIFTELGIDTAEEIDRWNEITKGIEDATEAKKKYLEEGSSDPVLFSSFSGTNLGERLDHINSKFEEGTLSHKDYFDSLNSEIENFDASNFTDSLEDAQNAAAQFFVDSTQQTASGLSSLINNFDSGKIGISEYLEGYLSIGNTINTLTDELQENSSAWDKNGQAISDAQNQALDATQSNLTSAMETIKGYQDSIYSLEQIMTGVVEAGSDDFKAHANVIAKDLANIVKSGGEMAEEVSKTLGTTTSEIAKSMSESVANQGLASQAIAANTNTAIADMATSIGELFDSLGQAISNFNVDLTFSKKSGSLIGAITGADPLEFSFTASGDSLNKIGSFVSSFGKQLSSNLAPQMIELPDFTFGNTEAGKNSSYKPSKDITKNYEDALDRIKDSSSSAKDTFEEVFDFFDRRVKILNDAISLLETNLENVTGSFAKNNLIDAQIGLNSEKINNYTDAMAMYTQKANEALSKLPSDLASKIKNGAVSLTTFVGEGNKDIVDAINEYSQWADKIADCKQELAGLKEAIRDLELAKFNNIMEDFTNQFDLHEGSKDLIDKQIDLFKEAGQLIGESFYTAQIDQTKKQLTLLEEEKKKLSEQMTSAVTSGRVEVGTDEWLEMVQSLKDVEASILDAKTALEEFDNALLELHTEIFNRIQDQFNNLHSELGNLEGLFDDFDMSGDKGGWSDEGLTRLGLLAQQYELSRYQIEQYNDEIDLLNKQYAEGRYSATEYSDKLAELSQAQWDCVNSSESIKDAIIELNQARIDEEIEGIEEEIDKFSELIDAQKEALQSRKELEDYKRQIADKSKSVEDLERQIAAMSMDTSASAIAKRKLLEEQLANARQDLEDTEREHSYNSQIEALDKELENYQKEKDAEIEALRQSLEDRESLIFNSMETVKQNSSIVGEELKNMAEYHGITISDAIITSWQNGENAIASYGAVLSAGSSTFIGNIMGVENEVYALQYQANATADSLAWMFATRADNLIGQLTNSYYSEENLNAMTNALRDSLVNTLERGYDVSSVVGSLNSIASAAHAAADAFRDMYTAANTGGTASSSPYGKGNPYQGVIPHAQQTDKAYSATYGKYVVVDKLTGNIVASGLTEEETKKYSASGGRYTINKYAKGSRNLDKDELAWTQEYGGEMIMSPTRNAILTPLKQGDTVLTKDQTDRIYEWSKIDPNRFFNNASFVKPVIPNAVNNNNPTLEFNGTLMHIDKVDSTNIKQMESIANKAVDRLVTKMSDGIRYRNF